MSGRIVLVITVLPFFYLSCVSSGLVTKCKQHDSKCAKESAQALIPIFAKGLPEHNVKALDPVSFKKIDASTPNLKLILTDVTVTGMKDCIMKKIKRDKSKNKIVVKLLCTCQVEGQYDMDGKLLILPMKGKGPMHVTLRKIELNVEGDMGEMEKEGVLYWDIKDWKHTFALKDKSEVVFDNLFDGNEILSQAAREVISKSGNEIIKEIGPSTVKTIVTEVVNNCNNFFHSVPVKELSLD